MNDETAISAAIDTAAGFEAGRRLVQNEVCYCVSGLISTLAAREWDGSDGIDPDDFATLSRRKPDADDYREEAAYAPAGTIPGRLVIDLQNGQWGWTLSASDSDEVEEGGDSDDNTEAGAWAAAFDHLGMDHPDGSDVLEHWIVSDMLADDLEERGEAVVRDLAGLTVWGRTTSGQAIYADALIQRIALAAYGLPDPVIPPAPPPPVRIVVDMTGGVLQGASIDHGAIELMTVDYDAFDGGATRKVPQAGGGAVDAETIKLAAYAVQPEWVLEMFTDHNRAHLDEGAE